MSASQKYDECIRVECDAEPVHRTGLCSTHFAEYQQAKQQPVDADVVVMELTEHPCQECGKDRGGRPKFCSTECRHRANDKTKTRSKPCLRCGGPKEYGIRGARYCNTCRTVMQPVWKELEAERARLRKSDLPRKRRPKFDDEGRIYCVNCDQYLMPAAFNKYKTKPQARCRPCQRQYHHEYNIKRKYGLDAEAYHKLLAITEGRCSICNNRPRTTRLAVDHDHKTGEIRGLLCKRCNRDLLGAARDSIELLERAVSYLESPPAQTGLPVLINEDYVDHRTAGKKKEL